MQVPIPLTFKTKRIEREWNDPRLNVTLRAMAIYTAWLILKFTGQASQMTEIKRSEAERRAIYAGTPEAEGPGVHEFFRGLDIVPLSRKIAPGVAHGIERRVNLAFPYEGSEGKPSCKFHDAGSGLHFHLQSGPNEPLFQPGPSTLTV